MEKDNLSYEEINTLLSQYKQSTNKKEQKQLKENIIKKCMPFVNKIAYSLARRTQESAEDIKQIGTIGLIKAIDLYEPQTSNQFKSYATRFITGEIKHYLRDSSNLIKYSRETKELSSKIRKVIPELTEKLKKIPDNKDIANALNIAPEKVEECLNIEKLTSTVSINQPSGEDENNISLVEKICDESNENLFKSNENRMVIEDAIKELQPLEQDLINLYYFEDLNQKELSERLCISQIKVSNTLNSALKKLAEIIKQNDENIFD